MAASTTKAGSLGFCELRVAIYRRCELMKVSSSAIETLIESGFTPRRTVVVASGIDEESAGYRVGGDGSGGYFLLLTDRR